MDNPTNADLARVLGSIQANQENLRREFERERDGASDHRRALRDTIAAMSEAVRTLTAQMAEILPLVSDYRETRDQARGAAKLSKIVWAAIAGIAALAGAAVNRILDHLK